MRILNSTYKLGTITPNIPVFLKNNLAKYGSKPVYQEKNSAGNYQSIGWNELYNKIMLIASNLSEIGFQKGDKMVLFSRNRLEMLELELAIMAFGGIAVPIFANFKKDTSKLLIQHSEAKYLAVAGIQQLNNLDITLELSAIIVFDNIMDDRFPKLIPFKDLLKEVKENQNILDVNLHSDTICLNMYTSGTMGTPKCVQLTHKNILSQQASLDVIWDLDDKDRFLSYLPWHHSFGGIFELFTALSNGALLSLESSYGKSPESIMKNWKEVRPTLFFSVPKVYQSLVELARADKEAEDLFYNSGLKFIFTAAASLPENISIEFEKRGIPVIEGWGLTETAPCCTLTDPSLKRASGVVGKPIPGVSIRINDDDDEIHVKGPNVMISYFKNDEANKGTFTEDGWYRTGDVGEITENGLKLICRKDRIFKLSNGEKVVPTDMEKLIKKKCHYVSYVVVSGSGKDHSVALVFPNKKLLQNSEYPDSEHKECFCPGNINELGRCLTGCMNDANNAIGQKFAKVKSAVVINGELSLDDQTLTPSMKMAPSNIVQKYKSHLLNLYGDDVPVDEEVYVINLDHNK